MYWSDDNLADDEENNTEPKRKRKQKLITVSSSSENDSNITELNQINTFGKKRLADKFFEGDNENENVQVPEKK